MQPPSPWCPAGPGTLQFLLPGLQSVLGLPVPSCCRLSVVPQRFCQALLHPQALLVANTHVEPALGILAQPPAQESKQRDFSTFFRAHCSGFGHLVKFTAPSLGLFSNLVPWREAESPALLLPIPFQLKLNSLISLQPPGLWQRTKEQLALQSIPVVSEVRAEVSWAAPHPDPTQTPSTP